MFMGQERTIIRTRLMLPPASQIDEVFGREACAEKSIPNLGRLPPAHQRVTAQIDRDFPPSFQTVMPRQIVRRG